MAKILLTGAAGFIGFHCVQKLCADGHEIIGVDNVNDYYDPALKQGRLAILQGIDGFSFVQGDIADEQLLAQIYQDHDDLTHIIHLAAQAGVRYSLENPVAYERSNLSGQMRVLELARRMQSDGVLAHLVYASSSSVYGANTKLPFSVEDRVDTPVSLYAATKKSGEILAQSYAHLYDIPSTGLRFFTVYGPWGRPDMAYFSFTQNLYAGQKIRIFNHGDMGRDFTYIDDIVDGVVASMHAPPKRGDIGTIGDTPHRLFNLGNNRPERLMDFVGILEELTGKRAVYDLLPMQLGDVKETYADITLTQRVLGYEPKTKLNQGLGEFIDWYKAFYIDKTIQIPASPVLLRG